MPVTTVHIRNTITPMQESALIEAVQAALVEGLKIPVQDRHVILQVHAPHRFIAPTGLAQPERFTWVSIDAFSGRTVQAKRQLYQAIVNSLEPLGIPRDHVLTTLRDIPLEDWGVRGGQAACDVDLGFNLKV